MQRTTPEWPCLGGRGLYLEFRAEWYPVNSLICRVTHRLQQQVHSGNLGTRQKGLLGTRPHGLPSKPP